ncbi:hypothetical protein [Chitinophaga tropicalis]|uniref:Uncharacterized protein n=1 Tax=Chitinophaga tropicalis TaxID=2683588 RepID=A0A7K1TYP8_9BACT|nr:hypothetical protein [Chitinophaga tropicalis]MVT06895.1 hypothetical protein [Chitinophaga tropicalis]
MKPSIISIRKTNTPAGVSRISVRGVMKRMLFLFAAILLSTSLTFAATKEMEATNTLKEALNKEFAGASAIKWYSEDNKTFMAKFTLNERSVTAYFDANGTLLATRRYIAVEHLPLAVSTKLTKRYPKEQVRWVVEFEKEGSTVYFITLENTDTWKVIKSSSTGDMSVHQRLKKA